MADTVPFATQWYTWILAAPTVVLWLMWTVLLMRYVQHQPCPLWLVRLSLFIILSSFLVSSITLSVLQYQAFKSGPLGKLSQGEFLRYFFGYVELHYWRAWIVGLAVSIIVGAIFWYIKKRTGGLLINQQEIELMVLFGLFSSWPHLIVFYVLTLLSFVFSSLAMTLLYTFKPLTFLNHGALNLKLETSETEIPEPPRLVITPFLFIAAFLTPIIARPILMDWLHLSVIYITTT